MSALEILSIPHELDAMTNALDERVESLAYGNENIQSTALQAAKFVFDLSLETEKSSKPLIDDLLSALNPLQKPQTRSQVKANGPLPQLPLPKSFEPTPLSSLLIDNMEAEQVWMQLDLRAQTICDLLDFALETGKIDEDDLSGEEEQPDVGDEYLRKMLESISNGQEVDFDGLEEEPGVGMDIDEGIHPESDESDDGGDDMVDLEDDIVYLRSSDEEPSESDTQVALTVITKASARSKKQKGANKGLDDGFFNLGSFNAETEQAEAQSSSRGRLGEDSDDSEEDNMSVDLFTPLEEAEEEVGDTAEIFYRDFFEPPENTQLQLQSKEKARPNGTGRVRFQDEVRVKKIKPKGKNLPLSLLYGNGLGEDDEDEDEDEYEEDFWLGDADFDENLTSDTDSIGENEETDLVMGENGEEPADEGSDDLTQSQGSEADDNRATIERLKDDLFADDGVDKDDDLTAHEKRQLSLREQISQLEAENVAKKDWTLMGEADSRSRPQNSLLEEDLEFERVMKPVPVISEEVVQSLEQRIKARILDNQFDDVVRVRPLEDRPFLPSRIIELQDTKSAQSLAQIYESDYLASQGDIVEDRDGKLKKEHEEINQQWEKICNKLDALCNAHFIPKQPKAVISTVSNVPTASMESALPTAKATSSILAPEEVFDSVKSQTRSRSELTPTEKRALRTKERKAKKKRRETLEKGLNKMAKVPKGAGGVKKEKQAALQSIVKQGKGVTVVGKQGKHLSLPRKRQKP